jgi:hypothetical protein
MKSYVEDLEKMNGSLVTMTYEADQPISFYSSEFLDREIEISSGNSTGVKAFIFHTEEKIGSHGKKVFITSFNDVPNTILETIDFEILSLSKQYDEEIIEINC